MAQRHIGIAFDFSPSSKYALRWALEHIIKEGDHVIIVIVSKSAPYEVWEASGSPLVPLAEFQDARTAKQYGLTPFDPELHSLLHAKCGLKRLVVVVKAYFGDAREKICDGVVHLSLDCIVMGSRGLGTIKRAILGSVSNYVVNNAPCPVTVVKLPPECP